jgi:FtsP/CotA-like multicopper oxidase with cupredoxin domain
MMLLMLACTADEPVHDAVDSGEAEPIDSADTADSVVLTALPQVAEAEDLDPDPAVVHVSLVAGPYTTEVNGTVVEGFAYNEQVPGPLIRARVGDTVVVDFVNQLEAPTTVHWHGLPVPFEMDGVTWVHDAILPGLGFQFRFQVTESGTFWYHPHLDADHQVDLGLYGVLVVDDPAEPVLEHDIVVVWDTWNEDPEADVHTTPDPAEVVWTANGVVQPQLELAAGDRVRMRMINVSNLSYLDLTWPGLRQIGGDQGLIGALAEPASLLLAPGDRAEFELLPTSDFILQTGLHTASGGAASGDPLGLLRVRLPDGQAAPAPAAWPFPGGATPADPGTTDIVYVFSGGGTEDWLINGEVFPEVTVETLALGSDGVVELRNLSATEHPFHLHGQVFEVLSRNGVVPAVYEQADTVNVGIRETVRLLVHADNPGDWMAHCHLLPHAEGGMMTVLRVE